MKRTSDREMREESWLCISDNENPTQHINILFINPHPGVPGLELSAPWGQNGLGEGGVSQTSKSLVVRGQTLEADPVDSNSCSTPQDCVTLSKSHDLEQIA